MIDDLKRSADLRWLFDPVLHSSVDPLVLNAEEPFNPKIRAWLGLYRRAHICFYFCGLQAHCIDPLTNQNCIITYSWYLKYTNILSQRMQVWWWPQKLLHPAITVPLIPICHSHWCSLWLSKQICTPRRYPDPGKGFFFYIFLFNFAWHPWTKWLARVPLKLITEV